MSGVFGDGWHLFGIGSSACDHAIGGIMQAPENIWTDEFVSIVNSAAEADVVGASDIADAIADEDFGAFDEAYGSYSDSFARRGMPMYRKFDAHAALGEDAEREFRVLKIMESGFPVSRSLLNADLML